MTSDGAKAPSLGSSRPHQQRLKDSRRLMRHISRAKSTQGATAPICPIASTYPFRFVRANVVLKENTYRGRDTSSNFTSAQDEIQQDFDVSMSHVLDQVHHDLTAVCAAPAPAGPL